MNWECSIFVFNWFKDFGFCQSFDLMMMKVFAFKNVNNSTLSRFTMMIDFITNLIFNLIEQISIKFSLFFYLQEVGSIIGKKGEIVKRFREEVGQQRSSLKREKSFFHWIKVISMTKPITCTFEKSETCSLHNFLVI